MYHSRILTVHLQIYWKYLENSFFWVVSQWYSVNFNLVFSKVNFFKGGGVGTY